MTIDTSASSSEANRNLLLSRALDACKNFANVWIRDAFDDCGMSKYARQIQEKKINDLSLEMGFLYTGDLPRFARVAVALSTCIVEITKNKTEQLKIYEYTHRIIRIGRAYASLRSAL